MFCQFSTRPNEVKSGSQIPDRIAASARDVWESGCCAWDFTWSYWRQILYLNGDLSEGDKIITFT